jgi:hypothetical protein
MGSTSNQDKSVEINTARKVSHLKRAYCKTEQFSYKAVRLFYGGREMKNRHQLAQYNLENEVVVQAMVKTIPVTKDEELA